MTTWVSVGCQTVFSLLLYSKYSKSYIFFVRRSLNLRGLGLKIYFWKVQFSRRMIIMTNASITGNFLSAFGVSSMRIGGNYLRGNNWIKENIARIAKAASNNSCPVLSCPDHHDHHDHRDRGDHDDHGDPEEVGSYMRMLEVVHKEVGGCLISYNLRLACVRKLEVIQSDVRAFLRHSLKINYHELMSETPM